MPVSVAQTQFNSTMHDLEAKLHHVNDAVVDLKSGISELNFVLKLPDRIGKASKKLISLCNMAKGFAETAEHIGVTRPLGIVFGQIAAAVKAVAAEAGPIAAELGVMMKPLTSQLNILSKSLRLEAEKLDIDLAHVEDLAPSIDAAVKGLDSATHLATSLDPGGAVLLAAINAATHSAESAIASAQTA